MAFLKKYEMELICFLSFLLFLYGSFGRPPVNAELIWVNYAQEMLDHGLSFFPMRNGHILTLHPAGLSWLNYLCAWSSGSLSSTIRLLPNAFASALSIGIVYKIARYYSLNWARITVFLALGTYSFIDSARSLNPEALILLCYLWSFYLISKYKAAEKIKLILFLPMILAYLILGVSSFLLIFIETIILLSANLKANLLKKIIFYGLLLFLILIIGTIVIALLHLPWTEVKFLLKKEFLFSYSSHFLINVKNIFIYYLISFPLALIAFTLNFSLLFKKTGLGQLFRDLSLISVGAFFFLSNNHDLNPMVYLPLLPAFVLIGAFLWEKSSLNGITRSFVSAIHWLCLSAPFLGFSILIATIITLHIKSINCSLHTITATCGLVVCALFSIMTLIHLSSRNILNYPKRILGIGLSSFLIIFIFILQPLQVYLS